MTILHHLTTTLEVGSADINIHILQMSKLKVRQVK